MTDDRALLERAAERVAIPDHLADGVRRRRDRLKARRRISSAALATLIAFAALGWMFHVFSDDRFTPAPPAPSGLPGTAAFGDGLTIYTYGGPGSPLIRPLTTGNPLAWSPDGSKLLFSRPGLEQRFSALFVLGPDRSVTRISPGGVTTQGGSWSPDGSRVVFVAQTESFGGSIQVVKADGSDLHTLRAASDTFGFSSPEWSPDGRSIAYVRHVADYAIGDLFVMRADGSDARRVIGQPGALVYAADGLSFSPDGSRIVYFNMCTTWRRGSCVGGGSQGAAVQTVRPDGTDISTVFNTAGHDAIDVSWTPDGRWISFSYPFSPWTEDYVGDSIFLVHPDGSRLHRSEIGEATSVAWRPGAPVT
jgi:hypothetical protein